MRGIGLFAGGMFLGSMLSSLFGLGNFGWAADFLGLLFNVVLIYVLFKAVSAVWRAIRDVGIVHKKGRAEALPFCESWD